MQYDRFGGLTKWLLVGVGFLVMPGPWVSTARADWHTQWEQVVKAAKREGAVVVFGPPGPSARKTLTEGFQKQFPDIHVEYLGAVGAKLVPRILAERRAGQYLVDIYLGSTTSVLGSLLPAAALDPLAPALFLPDVADPRSWWQGRLDYADAGGKYNLVFGVRVKLPVAINPGLLKKEEIRSHADFLASKWHGKIVMKDPTIIGPGLSTAVFWYTHPELGKNFITNLFGKQNVSRLQDDRQILEAVARGTFAAALAPSDLIAPDLQAKGLSIEMLRAEQLKEGSFVSSGFSSVGLMNGAPHPNAAKVYLNWLLSKEAQLEWSKAAEYASLRMDVPRGHLDAAVVPREGVSYQRLYNEEFVHLQEEVLNFLNSVLK